jgi:peptidoglycan LD-endopeptidase CwlK
MAARLFENDIVFLQRFLKSAGFYSGKIDGIWGPKTDAAVNALDSISKEISLEFGIFDARTERNLVTLHPEAQRAARVFMRRAVNGGFNLRILSGIRSYAEQDALSAARSSVARVTDQQRNCVAHQRTIMKNDVSPGDFAPL